MKRGEIGEVYAVADKTRPRVVATMSGPWPVPLEVVRPMDHSAAGFLWRFLRRAARADVVLVLGACGASQKYVELVAALALRLRMLDRPALLVHDATWDLSSRTLERRAPLAARLVPKLVGTVVKAIDADNVHYGVLSSFEEREFPHRWGVDASRVHFTPYCYSLDKRLLADASEGGYLFAGGNSYRDYELLAAAVQDLSVPVRVASSWIPARPLPAGMVARPLRQSDYDREMLGSSAVVVPLERAVRSAGQQTYLNAMLAGKPVIVTEAPGVRDHVTDGETGLVVAPRPEALREAIDWVLAPANAVGVADMVQRAKAAVLARFNRERYYADLYGLAIAGWEALRAGSSQAPAKPSQPGGSGVVRSFSRRRRATIPG